MIAVASYTVLTNQLLVERYRALRLGDELSPGGQTTDLDWFMTDDAPFRSGSFEGCVTSETISGQLLMPDNQLARCHHQMRINKNQESNQDYIRAQNDLEDFVHLHPQNRKMLMI